MMSEDMSACRWGEAQHCEEIFSGKVRLDHLPLTPVSPDAAGEESSTPARPGQSATGETQRREGFSVGNFTAVGSSRCRETSEKMTRRENSHEFDNEDSSRRWVERGETKQNISV